MTWQETHTGDIGAKGQEDRRGSWQQLQRGWRRGAGQSPISPESCNLPLSSQPRTQRMRLCVLANSLLKRWFCVYLGAFFLRPESYKWKIVLKDGAKKSYPV